MAVNTSPISLSGGYNDFEHNYSTSQEEEEEEEEDNDDDDEDKDDYNNGDEDEENRLNREYKSRSKKPKIM
ncbi:hypothetical protein BHO_0900067 (plasmid) [Borrelia hermsii YBT]|uniref:Uncharacterized protein n=2 Tax=Borrelia hermsii TaxID=140 RepID=W5T239_BORHE|nr:hypothetical protein [Borrelia hermsii]AHH13292.1 hypothetical protein BHO_0900067 [Borrelia hermsii YBT]AHH14396.1 hypothetical protein BHW_0900003 [Borrelia hermsii MTW]